MSIKSGGIVSFYMEITGFRVVICHNEGNTGLYNLDKLVINKYLLLEILSQKRYYMDMGSSDEVGGQI